MKQNIYEILYPVFVPPAPHHILVSWDYHNKLPHRLGGFKQQRFILSQFRKLEKFIASRVTLCRDFRKEILPCLFQLLVDDYLSIPGPVPEPLQSPPLITLPSPPVSAMALCSSLIILANSFKVYENKP